MEGIRRHLREVWWLLMLRGIALILFGVVAVVWPAITLVAISTAFAVYLLIAGVINIIVGIRAEGSLSMWFLSLLLGLAQVGVGVYLLKNRLALAAFIAVIGIALIVYGIIEVIGAFEPGEDPGRQFLLIIGGALAIVAGFIELRYPASSGLAFTWVLGVWGLVVGAMQVAMCLSLHHRFFELDRI